jgi:hypothetical protein
VGKGVPAFVWVDRLRGEGITVGRMPTAPWGAMVVRASIRAVRRDVGDLRLAGSPVEALHPSDSATPEILRLSGSTVNVAPITSGIECTERAVPRRVRLEEVPA